MSASQSATASTPMKYTTAENLQQFQHEVAKVTKDALKLSLDCRRFPSARRDFINGFLGAVECALHDAVRQDPNALSGLLARIHQTLESMQRQPVEPLPEDP